MKQNRFLTLAATLLLIIGSTAAARAEKAAIVALEGAPVKILNYTAEYDLAEKKALVEHEIKYQNVSPAEIVSVRFGILEYNGYGDLLDNFYGYALEDSSKGEKDSATFINIAEHARFFEDLGAGYVWVDALRYADGTLWRAERSQILAELQKLKPEISEADLAGKKSLAAD